MAVTWIVDVPVNPAWGVSLTTAFSGSVKTVALVIVRLLCGRSPEVRFADPRPGDEQRSL